MNQELKERLWGIMLQEYGAHLAEPDKRKTSWWNRLEASGFKLTDSDESLPDHVVVGHRLVFGIIQIPVEVAEKMLALGHIP